MKKTYYCSGILAEESFEWKRVTESKEGVFDYLAEIQLKAFTKQKTCSITVLCIDEHQNFYSGAVFNVTPNGVLIDTEIYKELEKKTE